MKLVGDPTDKHLADQRLRESEERFAKAFRSISTPFAILELPELRAVEVNDAFIDAFQLDGSALVGRPLEELCCEAEEGVFEQVRDELAHGRSARVETTFRLSGAKHSYGVFVFEPIELGTVRHAVMLMYDVTDRRRGQELLKLENQFVNDVLASLPGIFYMLDGHRFVQWNDELESVTGLTRDELTRLAADDVIGESEEVREQIAIALRTGHARMEGYLRNRDGATVPYLLTGRRVTRAGQNLVLGIGINISEQMAARRVVHRRAREQAVIVDVAAMAFSLGGLDPILELAARRVAETLKARRVQIVEANAVGYTLRAVVDDSSAVASTLNITNEALTERARLAIGDGETGWWPAELLSSLGLTSGIHAQIGGRGGKPFGFIEALSDRPHAFTEEDVNFLRALAYLLAATTERDRLHRQLEHRANHDGLTDLLTRSAFEGRLQGTLAQAERNQTKVAALFIDLDRFKSVNDSLGHQVGDEILRKVAQRLQESMRSWDVIARLGGDEFALFMPDIESSAEITHVTTRLLAALEMPFAAAGREIRISATIGIAVFPEDGHDVRTLMQAADTALYEGKARGRNTFHFFTRKQHVRAMERLELEEQLRRALDDDEFHVVYQPQVDFSTNTVRAVEALIRWQHPTRGSLAPSEFLPIALDIGLAVPVGEWVIRRALRDHVRWRGLPNAPERVAINVSPPHFIQPTFPDALLALAQAEEVEPHEIEIELIESTLLRDPELVTQHIHSIKQHGIGIVLDDFGTSAAPLASLRSLPIDGLKVDGTFMHHLHEPKGRRLVESIVQIALGLGMHPIAAGIETKEQDLAAREVGFKTGQGRYYLAESTPEQILGFLAERTS